MASVAQGNLQVSLPWLLHSVTKPEPRVAFSWREGTEKGAIYAVPLAPTCFSADHEPEQSQTDVEFIRQAIAKWTQKLLGADQEKLQNFRMAPPSPDWDLDDTGKAQAIVKIWADQFAIDKATLLKYLTEA